MPKKKALIVAIDHYGGDNDLNSCLADGKALSRRLQELEGFDEVCQLYDGEATIANVEAKLDWLTRDVQEGDDIFFGFSGHGFSNLRAAVIEEYFVLLDEQGEIALWNDDVLVKLSQRVPPGTFRAYCDCCHARGMTKLVISPIGGEVAKIKALHPAPEGTSKGVIPKADAEAGARVVARHRFGRRPRPLGLRKSLATPDGFIEDASEAGQPEFNGLMFLACDEDETAAAATSQTGGLSAFTCKFLDSLPHLPPGASCREVIDVTARRLASAGFRQTCSVWAPKDFYLDQPFSTVDVPSGPALARTATEPRRDPPAPTTNGLIELLRSALPYLLAARPVAGLSNPNTQQDTTINMSNSTEAISNGSSPEKFLQLLIPILTSTIPIVIDLANGSNKKKDLALATTPDAPNAEHARLQLLRSLLDMLPQAGRHALLAEQPSVALVRPVANAGSDKALLDFIKIGVDLFGDVLRATKTKDIAPPPRQGETVVLDKAVFDNLVRSVINLVPHIGRVADQVSESVPDALGVALSVLNGIQRRAA
jgi:hypothetical protein